MTTPATAVPNALQGPGYLLRAPLGSTEPTNTVVGSVFTDTWDAAWVNLGATSEGTEFTSSLTVEPVEFAEFIDHVLYATTGRESSISFALGSFTAANVKIAFNGGTLTTSGSTTTTKNVFTPPTPGTDDRSMIGWESLDHTVRLIGYQAISSGDVTLAFKKAPEKAVLPCEFRLEVPTSGIPWKIITAGAAR